MSHCPTNNQQYTSIAKKNGHCVGKYRCALANRRTHRYRPDNYKLSTLLLLTVLILAACGTSTEQLTLVADNEIASTQITDIRGTATVARARIQTTLDFVGTRVIEVEQQGQFLRSTLVALGTDSAFVSNSLPLPGDFPTFTPQPTSPIQVQVTPATQAPIGAEVNAEGTNVQVTIEPTEPAAEPRLDNIVLSSGVDDNDCAININPRFTTDSTEIYVVATAYNIPAGTTISSIWQSNGTEVANFSFQPETSIHGNCIWFFIDQTDAVFVPGAWSVELRIDDVPAALPLPFQIMES